MPKPFVGHSRVIQESAIRSWTLLRPRPEVILFSVELGTGDVTQALGVTHGGRIATNEYGTPLLDDVFEQARLQTHSPALCYVNADIVLTQELMHAVRVVNERYDRYLLVGKRWNLRKKEPIDFTPEWRERLDDEVRARGRPGLSTQIDYFVFPRDLYGRIPPFAVGRPCWDNWMLWAARKAGAPVIDASDMFRAIHLDHDYAPVSGDEHGLWQAPEARRNQELVGGWDRVYTLDHATHRVDVHGIRRNLNMRTARAYGSTFRKRLINATRPVRHALGLRLRAKHP